MDLPSSNDQHRDSDVEFDICNAKMKLSTHQIMCLALQSSRDGKSQLNGI